MSKKISKSQEIVSKSNGKTATHSERADFVSYTKGHSSYIERNWARVQDWAVVERPDLHPAPMLTDAARAALAEERGHANRD